MEPILEGAPTDDQKERLEDFLTELTLLVRKYRIVLLDVDSGVEIHDLNSEHLIGLGLSCWTAPGDRRRVREYTPVDSILDGVWPVDTPTGHTEQRHVGNVFPLRDQ